MSKLSPPVRSIVQAGLLSCIWFFLVATGSLLAVEFAVPPGQDVERQQRILRERILELARDLVGQEVLEVRTQVRYLRTERRQNATDNQVKLPGFNHFLSAGKGAPRILPQYTRLRQVFVMVAKNVSMEPKALEAELIKLAGLEASRGDLLQVVRTATLSEEAAEAELAKAVQSAKNKAEGDMERQSEENRLEEENRREELAARGQGGTRRARYGTGGGRKILLDDDPLAEPESTVNLIKARAAFFERDYNRALDQILQSIDKNPNNPQAYAMLGSLYFAMNWQSLALKYWERALRMDPENREIENLIAQLRSSRTGVTEATDIR